jgi:hypothetical protein
LKIGMRRRMNEVDARAKAEEEAKLKTIPLAQRGAAEIDDADAALPGSLDVPVVESADLTGAMGSGRRREPEAPGSGNVETAEGVPETETATVATA